ncbi:MAG: prephenate dehydratase [Prevotellaceae bacterium]|jgi:prephenate dehydratase|nr:prephenate dehydratase [Prevotellaceae bacterium]
MKKVAIQGALGSFHEIAVRQYFGKEDLDIMPCETFKDVFAAIERNSTVIGIIAIENTIAGSLLPNYNLLKESGCVVIGEHKLRIEHNLVALKGQRITDLTEVHSQSIALLQCGEFLEQHKFLKAVESFDTAGSAKIIAEEQIGQRGAICSAAAAERYGLEILAQGIETNKRNFTRFLMVANPARAGEWQQGQTLNKSSLVFTLPHEEGSLAKVLSILSFYHVNLTKIQSLPVIGREWEYEFYINLTFDNWERYKQSLDAIRPLIKDFQILGEYTACEL